MTSQAKSKQESAPPKGRRSNTNNTKKGPQVGAKEAIGTFCLFLHQHGTVKLSAEELRQAKFDRHEAVFPMWELLHQLSSFTLHDKFPKIQNPSPLRTNPDETIQTIKDIIWWHGYRCSQFFNLPSSMTIGSQELLLACGWLMAKTSLLSKLTESNQMPFIGGDTAYLHMQTLHSEDSDVSNEQYQEARKALSPSGLAKQLAWMAGHCKMSFRNLHLKQQELCHLTHQIHVATQGVSISSDLQHLSLLETFLLRHPHHMQKYQDLLHTEILRLQTCVKWREQEHVFWQWMESVLDAKLSSNSTASEDSSPLDNFLPSSFGGIDIQTSRELQRVSKELGGIISQVQEELKDLPEEQHEEISEQIELIKREIACDVERTFASAIKPDGGEFTQQKRPIRLQYIPAANKGAKSSKLKAQQTGQLTVRDEVARLETFVRDLELQHRELRDKIKGDMDGIGDRMEGVVCIPPIGKTKY